MAQLVDNNPAIPAACEEFRHFSSNLERQDMERRHRRFLEDQRIYADAAKDEGFALGKTEGKAEIVRNMKNEGFDTVVIVKMTGLFRSESEELN